MQSVSERKQNSDHLCARWRDKEAGNISREAVSTCARDPLFFHLQTLSFLIGVTFNKVQLRLMCESCHDLCHIKDHTNLFGWIPFLLLKLSFSSELKV